MSNFLTEDERKKLTNEYLRPHFDALEGRYIDVKKYLASLAPGLTEFLNRKGYEKILQQQEAEDQARKKGLAPLRENLRKNPQFDEKEIDFGDPESIQFRVKFRDNKLSLNLTELNITIRNGLFETMLIHDTNLLHDTLLGFEQDETDKIADYIFWIDDTLKKTSEDLHMIIRKISPKIADFYRDEKKIDGTDVLIHSNDFFLDALSKFSEENNYNVCKQEKRIADCFSRLRGCDKLSFR